MNICKNIHVFSFVFLLLLSNKVIEIKTFDIGSAISLGIEICGLILEVKQVVDNNEGISKLSAILNKVYMNNGDNFGEIAEIIVNIHFDSEVEIPQQIMSESIIYNIKNPSETSRNYLNQTCMIYRQKDLLIKFLNIITENRLYFYKIIKNYNFITTKIDIIYQKLINTMNNIIINYSICNKLNNIEKNESFESIRDIVNEINIEMNNHFGYIHDRYFHESAENIINQHCINNCNGNVAESVYKVLNQNYDYSDDFYVYATTKRCHVFKQSSNLLTLNIHDYTVYVYKSRSVDTKVKIHPNVKEELSSNNDKYCHGVISKDINFEALNQSLSPLFEKQNFLTVCEKDKKSYSKLASHVDTRTYKICNYFLKFKLSSEKGITLIYGNDFNDFNPKYMDKYHASNYSGIIENIHRVKRSLKKSISTTIATTTSSTTTVNVNNVIKKYSVQIIYSINKNFNKKFNDLTGILLNNYELYFNDSSKTVTLSNSNINTINYFLLFFASTLISIII